MCIRDRDDIVEIMARANAAFNKKLSDLAFVQACGCEPCTQSKNLRLKICAHKGNFSLNTIRNFEELSGEDVILTHRMLKNDIESSEYWLVTNGKPLITIHNNKFIKKPNESVFIPKGAIHRIQNPGRTTVKIMEAQLGSVLKETDIVRYEDIYGRIN